ncbi:hypothetical protein DVH24_041234 [Malus domestica]|uniref:Uncharacterized protein n=1 Tax=Malus domestica TaxID=3750 RepID=A0A498IDJ1_MALDO|nr:hypothetical protein DVH24_041234 [Malus domestica]
MIQKCSKNKKKQTYEVLPDINLFWISNLLAEIIKSRSFSLSLKSSNRFVVMKLKPLYSTKNPNPERKKKTQKSIILKSNQNHERVGEKLGSSSQL